MTKTAEEKYNEREKRIQDAIQLKKPDRIPIIPFDNGAYFKHCGLNFQEAMYHPKQYFGAVKKAIMDFDMDAVSSAVVMSGPTFDALDWRQLKWPGAEVDSSNTGRDTVYQFIEPGQGYEAMPPEDYDWFLDDPTDYIIRRHWPRIARSLKPLENLPPIHDMVAYYVGFVPYLPAYGSSEIRGALESLMDAGKEAIKFYDAHYSFIGEMAELGYPPLFRGIGISPYDYIADFLRGTQGSMVDMFRRPDKLKRAVEKVTPWVIQWCVNQVGASKELDYSKRLFIPIHKGAGGFMSNEQFKEFYWPSMLEVINGLINKGIVPYVYTEGIYTDRLPIIKDVPKGKVIYHIESDIFKAIETLMDTACVEGGPSGPMLSIRTPQEVKDYCKKIIDAVGGRGGFMMGVEVPMITDKSENIKAMVDFTKEYGAY